MATVNDYGMKISQAGFDVKTCDVKDLVMTSSLNLLKTYVTGEGTIGNFVFFTALAYNPIFFAVGRLDKGASPRYGFIGDNKSYANSESIFVMDFDIRYYIFYQQAV